MWSEVLLVSVVLAAAPLGGGLQLRQQEHQDSSEDFQQRTADSEMCFFPPCPTIHEVTPNPLEGEVSRLRDELRTVQSRLDNSRQVIAHMKKEATRAVAVCDERLRVAGGVAAVKQAEARRSLQAECEKNSTVTVAAVRTELVTRHVEQLRVHREACEAQVKKAREEALSLCPTPPPPQRGGQLQQQPHKPPSNLQQQAEQLGDDSEDYQQRRGVEDEILAEIQQQQRRGELLPAQGSAEEDLTQQRGQVEDFTQDFTQLTQQRGEVEDFTQQRGRPEDFTQQRGEAEDLTQQRGEPEDLTQQRGEPEDLTQQRGEDAEDLQQQHGGHDPEDLAALQALQQQRRTEEGVIEQLRGEHDVSPGQRREPPEHRPAGQQRDDRLVIPEASRDGKCLRGSEERQKCEKLEHLHANQSAENAALRAELARVSSSLSACQRPAVLPSPVPPNQGGQRSPLIPEDQQTRLDPSDVLEPPGLLSVTPPPRVPERAAVTPATLVEPGVSSECQAYVTPSEVTQVDTKLEDSYVIDKRQYIFGKSTMRVTWEGARQACEARGMAMLQLETEQESRRLQQRIALRSFGSRYDVWLGGRWRPGSVRSYMERQHVWSCGDRGPATLVPPALPSRLVFSTYECLILSNPRPASRDAAWSSSGCNFVRQYACEKQLV